MMAISSPHQKLSPSSLFALLLFLLACTIPLPCKAQFHIQAYVFKVKSYEGDWYNPKSCWESGKNHFFRQYQLTACFDPSEASCFLASAATKCEECASSNSCTRNYDWDSALVKIDQGGLSTSASVYATFSAYESKDLPQYQCNFGDGAIFDRRYCETFSDKVFSSLTADNPDEWKEKGPIGNDNHKLWFLTKWNCDSGYFGRSCEQCPGSGTCSGHGTCMDGVGGSGECVCFGGHTLFDCSSLSPTPSPTESQLPSPSPSLSPDPSSSETASTSASISPSPSPSETNAQNILPIISISSSSASISPSIVPSSLRSPSITPVATASISPSPPTLQPIMAINDGKSKSDSVSMTTTGVVAGLGGFVVLVGLLAMFFMKKRRHNQLQNAVVHKDKPYPPPERDQDIDLVVNPLSIVNSRSLQQRLSQAETRLANISAPPLPTATAPSLPRTLTATTNGSGPSHPIASAKPLSPIATRPQRSSASQLSFPSRCSTLSANTLTTSECLSSCDGGSTLSSTLGHDVLRKGSDDSEVVELFGDIPEQK